METSYHCVGHSLGSHTCGFAGKNLARLGLRMSRISALDPAGPLFLKQSLRGNVSQDTASARQENICNSDCLDVSPSFYDLCTCGPQIKNILISLSLNNKPYI